ncbi:MAG: hypothetical protein GY759_21375 [Chloroflexi bacterium]|nr:hypothetical protein [Chloroflexota bacterium]
MSADLPRLRRWLQRHQLQTPAAIIAETYRPLGFFAGQVLSAMDPLLPGIQAKGWGKTLSSWEEEDTNRQLNQSDSKQTTAKS